MTMLHELCAHFMGGGHLWGTYFTPRYIHREPRARGPAGTGRSNPHTATYAGRSAVHRLRPHKAYSGICRNVLFCLRFWLLYARQGLTINWLGISKVEIL